MTATLPEAQARTMLREHCGGDGLEGWLADQTWHATEDGSWRVESGREGRTYRVEPVPGHSVRVVERALGVGAVTAWLIGP